MIDQTSSTPQHGASPLGPRTGIGGPPPLEEAMASDLAALGRRLAPRWWFYLLESMLLGLALGVMRVSAGWSAIAVAVMCLVLLVLQRSLYGRVRAARIDRSVAAASLSGWWLAGTLAVIGVLTFFGSFRLDRVLTTWIAAAGLMLALAACLYVMAQRMERSTVRGLLDGSVLAEPARASHPEVKPVFAEPESLRLAVVLSCVEEIRRDALRHDLGLPRGRFDQLVAGLTRHGVAIENHVTRRGAVDPGSDDEASAWLRLSLRRRRVLREHLAALQAGPLETVAPVERTPPRSTLSSSS